MKTYGLKIVFSMGAFATTWLLCRTYSKTKEAKYESQVRMEELRLKNKAYIPDANTTDNTKSK